MIREVWRIVADMWLFASLLLGWVVLCSVSVEHWDWPEMPVGIVALTPFVVFLILAIVGQVMPRKPRPKLPKK